MAIIIPIESIEFKRLRKRTFDEEEDTLERRRTTLRTQGFTQPDVAPPIPPLPTPPPQIPTPIPPTTVPTATPTRAAPEPVISGLDRPTITPEDAMQAFGSRELREEMIRQAPERTAAPRPPQVEVLPPQTSKEILKDIDNVLRQQDDFRSQGSAVDTDLVNALVEQRREIRRGRPGKDLIEAIDILSAIYGGTLVDAFNNIKAGDFGVIGPDDFENPLDVAERQQARTGLVRIASEAFTPIEALMIARTIPALVKLAGVTAQRTAGAVGQGIIRATDAPIIRLAKVTPAQAAGLSADEADRLTFLKRIEGSSEEARPFLAKRPKGPPTKEQIADQIDDATTGVKDTEDALKTGKAGGDDAEELRELQNALTDARAELRAAKKPFDTEAFDKATATAAKEEAGFTEGLRKIREEIAQLEGRQVSAAAVPPFQPTTPARAAPNEVSRIRTELTEASDRLVKSEQLLEDLSNKLKLQGATLKEGRLSLPNSASDAAFRDLDQYEEIVTDLRFKRIIVEGWERQLGEAAVPPSTTPAPGDVTGRLSQEPGPLGEFFRNRPTRTANKAAFEDFVQNNIQPAFFQKFGDSPFTNVVRREDEFLIEITSAGWNQKAVDLGLERVPGQGNFYRVPEIPGTALRPTTPTRAAGTAPPGAGRPPGQRVHPVSTPESDAAVVRETGTRNPKNILGFFQKQNPELKGIRIRGLESTPESGPLTDAGVAKIVMKDGKLVGRESAIHLTADASPTTVRHEIEHFLDAIRGAKLDPSNPTFTRFSHEDFAAELAARSGGGRPPGPPPELPTKPGPLPELPPELPERVAHALKQAEAFRSIDAPGFTGGFLDKIPGISHIQNWLRPANKLPPQIQNAWVAAHGERAAFLTDQFPSRSRIFDQIDDLFGTRMVDESGRSVQGPSPLEGGFTNVRFIGPESERVGIEGTVFDIAQSPHFYDLTDEMRAFIIDWQANHMHRFQQELIQGYGARVGEFIPVEGGAFLRNVDKGEDMLTSMNMSEAQAIRQGAGGTRVYQTARDRMKADPDFDPVVDIRKLMSGMDEWRAVRAGNEVFRQGIGGLTRVEAVAKKHPALLKLKTDLTRQINNLKSRLNTAERQIVATGGEINRTSTALTKVTEKADPLLDRVAGLELLKDEGWGPELSFLSGQVRELLAQAARLERRGVSLTERGVGALERRKTILTDLGELSPKLEQVRRRYDAADLRPLQFQADVFRYFPADEAKAITELSQFSKNPIVAFLDNIRGTAFSADMSPIAGVQLPLHMLFQPHRAVPALVGAGKSSIQSRDLLHVFRERTMAQIVEANPQLARDFAFFTGLPVQTGTIAEFSGGFLRMINPTIRGKRIAFGEKFQVFTERMFTLAMRQSLDTFDDITQTLARSGVGGDAGKVIAADMATKVIPVWNSARLGLSQARAALIRSLPTSVSFLLRSSALISEATTGFAKIGLKMTLTPQESIAVKLITRATGSVFALTTSSAALDALSRGNDPIAAIKNAVDPSSGKFMHLYIVGTGRSIPLGGPFRGIFKVIWPTEVDWAPVPVPFGNIANFALARTNPFLVGKLRLVMNRDFFGGKILKGSFPEQVARGLAYEIESDVPLTVGTVFAGVRRGLDIGDIAEEAGGQFLGVNIRQDTPSQERDLDVQQWAKDQGIERGQVFELVIDGETVEVDQSQKIESFYDLVPRDRRRYEDENSAMVKKIKEETERQARQGVKWAVLRQEVEDLAQDSLKFQLADDDLLNNRRISPTEWRSRRKKRKSKFNDQREVIYSDLDPKDPTTVLDYFYSEFDKIKLKFGNVMTDGAWEELETWVASQPKDVRKYIDENTGLAPLTLKEQEYKADLDILRDYWAQPDIIVAAQSPEDQKIYDGYQKISPTDKTRITSPLAGDSKTVIAIKKHNRDVINAVNKQINKKLKEIRFNNSSIRGALIKWEFNVGMKLIQIKSAEEFQEATP